MVFYFMNVERLFFVCFTRLSKGVHGTCNTHTHTHTHTYILNQMREMKEKDKEKYDSKSTLTTVHLGLL